MWCHADSDAAIAAAELPRLGLAFRERIVDGQRMLFSVDHANLFLPNFPYGTPQVTYF